MATDHLEGSEFSWRRVLPWTELFRGFQVALDLNKLLLAAAGILVMHLGWWLLSIAFTVPLPEHPPEFEQIKNWAVFQEGRERWNLMHEAADLADGERRAWEVADLAETREEYELLKGQGVETGTQYRALVERLRTDADFRKEKGVTLEQVDRYVTRSRDYDKLGFDKPRGTLSDWPWFEDRGPNPYLLVTRKAGIPWEAGHFWEWFIRHQLPVMVEPLVKFYRPIEYLFSPRADFVGRLYFLCVTLWTLITWSFFGGAITRIAVVQVARGERIGLVEALRYTLRRYLSYLTAPLFPLGGIVAILLLMFLFGLFHMIPLAGDILVSGLFWPVVIVLGLLMAITLIGLVSWPLMSATISAEGHDSWEAVSRAYSYLFQRPWQYLGYGLIAIAYGAVLVFFVGLMASLAVYLAEWGVARIQPESRDPAYLFVYAPTSFGWRSLLLQDAKTVDANVVHQGEINPEAYQEYLASGDWHWWNTVGAVMMAFWMGLIFLMVIGFGYSYFWSASSIIYLLMRRSIDTAELDEVYLEEEEPESPFGPALAPAPGGHGPGPAADTFKPGQVPLTMAAPPPPGGPPATSPSALGGVPPRPEPRETPGAHAPGSPAPAPPPPATTPPPETRPAPGSPAEDEEEGEETT